MRVRALGPDDAAALVTLRREALTMDPLSFESSVDDDRALSIDNVRESLTTPERAAIFGAFEGATLVGMVGIMRLTRVKTRHRALVWGMFVTPAARGTGVGAALLNAAVDRARSWPGVVQVQLTV